MKATEFVKRFGWLKAHSIVNHFSGDFEYKARDGEVLFKFDVDCLKRLIESHEFVKDHGGLSGCKKWYSTSPFKRDKYMKELKQAIADVEACL